MSRKIWSLDLSLDPVNKKTPENTSEAHSCDPAEAKENYERKTHSHL